jgi:hypothetical protein
MNELRYTLVADGSSDNALIPILTWLFIRNGVACAIQSSLADLRNLQIPRKEISDRIIKSYDLFPCDILFIHRDAEKESREKRMEEINNAIKIVQQKINPPPYICVIPVRMTEAWLLIDEAAIKRAAGNPNNKEKLDLPRIQKLEDLPNPKEVLYDLLIKSCGLSGRRLKQFLAFQHAGNVSEYIADFSPLRQLPAFSLLETDVKNYVNTLTIDNS